jgi:hypothetical protein
MSIKGRFNLGGLGLALAIAAAGCTKPDSISGGTGGSSAASGGHPGTASGGTVGSGAGGAITTGAGGTPATGAGGTATTSTGGTPGGTGTGGTPTTSTGGATGAGGAGGAAVVQKDCATKTVVMNPIFMNFENYNGMVTADNYATAFGGTTVNTGNAYAGIYGYPESSTSTAPTLSIGGGHPPSMWAGAETLAATMWGMGGGVWMGCADASAYKGISFWVRGTSGKGTFQFSISMESTQLPSGTNNAGGGTCPGVAASAGVTATCVDPTMTNIPLTADWTQVTIMWADFTPGLSGTTSVLPNGDNIVGMAWSVPLAFEADPSQPADAGVYIPVPETLTINIDDITFVQ